jgi:RNA 2',3'-cyclic 3'-phosphodiesterase
VSQGRRAERVRVFVALDIPEDVRAALGTLVTRLRAAGQNILARPSARWARIEGIHVTLKFIGEIPPEKIEPVKAALARMPFSNSIAIKFRGVGFFPNERRPGVFWAGVEAGPELSELATAVEKSLEPLGIAKEQRTFSPHLTLARFEDRAGAISTLNAIRDAISEAGPLEFGSAIAKEFHLYQSILKRGGAEYTRLATFHFAGGESQ